MVKTATLVRKRSSYADSVYERLKADILDGGIEPGERLLEDELSTRFKVSRTPVREALNRLEADGLVVDSPGRGVVVTEFGEDEILEGYVIRGVLEGVAARLAAQRATELDIHRLELVLDALEKAGTANDIDTAIRLSGDFHSQLWQLAGNRRLLKLMRDIEATMGRYQRLTMAHPGRTQQAIHEHHEILDAIRARDLDRAEALGRAHMQEAQRTRISMSIAARHSEPEAK
jgi:DNA-binding GntR family transcriptional regulator